MIHGVRDPAEIIAGPVSVKRLSMGAKSSAMRK